MPSKIYNRTTGGLALGAGQDANGNFVVFENGVRVYALTIAVTPGTTATTAVVGSLATTSNATGRGRFYTSNGSFWANVSNV